MRLREAALAGLAAAWISGACASGGTPTVRLEALEAAPPGGGPLAAVTFMSGCWRGRSADGGTVIEERYTPAEGSLILGTTRFIRDGAVVGFEFTTLEAKGEGVVYTPYPGGDRSADPFTLTAGGPARAVFEAPEHDYPKRILYERVEEGRLRARIDAGADDSEPRVWEMEGVPCV